MWTQDIFALGLGVQSPWGVDGQHLDTTTEPYTLNLRPGAARGRLYPCLACGKLCKAHDFQEMRWRHLAFFQHHGYLTAKVPRVNCSEHGFGRVRVPWARPGSGFTLLFESSSMFSLEFAVSQDNPPRNISRGTTCNSLKLQNIFAWFLGFERQGNTRCERKKNAATSGEPWWRPILGRRPTC